MDSKRFLSLKKAEKNSFVTRFFKDVYIEDEKLKESILDWIFRLNQRNISIKKFSFLLSKYEGIVFPIKLYGYPRNIQIEDNIGNHFYLWYNPCFDITEYSVGKRTKDFDTEFTYHLSETSAISLKELCILKLDGNGVNTDKHVTFHYDLSNPITKVVLETKLKNENINLTITYEAATSSQDNKISTYLFNLANKSKYISNIWQVSESVSKDITKILEPNCILSIAYSKKLF